MDNLDTKDALKSADRFFNDAKTEFEKQGILFDKEEQIGRCIEYYYICLLEQLVGTKETQKAMDVVGNHMRVWDDA